MATTSWPHVIAALVESGLTQPEIARECRVSQSTLSDISRGVTKDPRYSTGARLLRMAAERGIPTQHVEGASA